MRVFISFDVENEKIESIKRELIGTGVKVVSSFHLTLAFLGEVEEEKIERIRSAMEYGVGKVKSFNIPLKGVGAFPDTHRPRVIWVHSEAAELYEIHSRLSDMLIESGIQHDSRFTPHITLARVKKRVDLDGFFHKYGDVEFGEFEARELSLNSSTLTSTGPEYKKILGVCLGK